MSRISERIARLTPEQRVVLAREIQADLSPERARPKSEPIAIIGLGCRFPGADNSQEFWRLLISGQDAIREIPKDRWDVDALYDPQLSSPDSINTRWGGFLERFDGSCAAAFGLSAGEIAVMDPQQRLALEVAWQALEQAGIAPQQLKGSATGVFLGLSSLDFAMEQTGAPARGGTGVALSIAANRLSYLLDLHGPSLVVDTACSSSLVAVDLACQSLRSGACSLALAGGMNVLLSSKMTISLCQAGMLAPDGRCKTFDAEANGYGRGEGGGVVVLKRLSNALEAKDPILAVLRGSAVNHNGRSNGLTAPSVLAQQAVIRMALENAGVAAEEIDYVEAHGSGTPLGDAMEVRALRAVYEAGREQLPRLRLGSVKTNVGHLEAAAGIAGLAKVVLSLHHQEIPPHLHLTRLNPRLADNGFPFEIPTARLPWPRGARPRRAGVSSFGFGGANAHLIVEEAPAAALAPANGNARTVEATGRALA